MAKSDWTGNVAGAERVEVSENGGPRTARDMVSETIYAGPDAENRARATAAGLKDAAYIDYGVALEAYQSREDIETLQSKQTRNAPADFDAAGYMRELPNRSGGNGYAPDPDNAIEDDFFAGLSGSDVV
jgi:hypothetical protein